MRRPDFVKARVPRAGMVYGTSVANSKGVTIHPTAVVEEGAEIGPGTRIWHHAQVRESARIGAGCILGKNVYVDGGVTVGDNVKIQNNSSLYHPLVLEDGVFVGPHVVFANDRIPRAINPNGSPKSAADWTASRTIVGYGASIGAGAIILPGLRIGAWALVGAGSVVTRDVPDHAIVVGNPARGTGFACSCGARLPAETGSVRCGVCGTVLELP